MVTLSCDQKQYFTCISYTIKGDQREPYSYEGPEVPKYYLHTKGGSVVTLYYLHIGHHFIRNKI